MEITVFVSFEKNIFKDSLEAYYYMKGLVNFNITQCYLQYRNGQQSFDEAEIESYLLEYNDSTLTLGAETEDNDDFEKILFRKSHPVFNFESMVISVHQFATIDFHFLTNHSHKYNFTIAYTTNTLKAMWQNQIFVHQFDVFKHPYTFVKTKKNFMSSNPIAGDMVDIFYNPGHERMVYGMKLMAAPDMWFGERALMYFDKQKLLSYPNALEIKELENGVVYIKLFDIEEPDWETPEILSLQKHFRAWSNMNEIEKTLRDKIPNHDRILA